MDLKEEAVLGEHIDDHWYYLSKAKMLASHLDPSTATVLDVGAGSGWFSRWLINRKFASSATLVDPGYEREHSETIAAGKTLDFRRDIQSSDADLVLFMDVLEHVDDDVGLLKEYIAKTKPGTKFFITVPAFEFLWSAHDDFLEHRRRYTIGSLEQAIVSAGAKPQSMHYYFGSIFPAAALVRLWQRSRKADHSDMKPSHPVVNWILRKVCTLERSWMRLNRIGGLSVVCMCQR